MPLKPTTLRHPFRDLARRLPLPGRTAQTSLVAVVIATALLFGASLASARGVDNATDDSTIVVIDDRQTEHRFAAPPERIVSLLPSLTEAIWALGGGTRLVGVDRYSNWPEVGMLPGGGTAFPRDANRSYFEINGGPHAAGTSSFIGETMARLGLVNIAPPELGPFPKLNPEFIVRARPWIAIGLDRDMAALPGRPGWRTIPAVHEGRLWGLSNLDYEMLIRPGPRLGDAAALLVDCLAKAGR